MIYLDTSVALAHLLAKDRAPPDALWQEPLIASRLLEYECASFDHLVGHFVGWVSAAPLQRLLPQPRCRA